MSRLPEPGYGLVDRGRELSYAETRMPNPTVIFIDSSSLRALSPRGNEARALQNLVDVKAIEILYLRS